LPGHQNFPLVSVRRKDLLAASAALTAQLARQPKTLGVEYAKLAREYARIALGRSEIAPASGDRRFADPAWTKNGAFRRLLQSYVALGQSLDRCVDDAKLEASSAARARFAVSLFVDALAPTNFVASNPTALKKLVDTKGASVIRGFANFVEDLGRGSRLPRQVDTRPFAVGKNLAATLTESLLHDSDTQHWRMWCKHADIAYRPRGGERRFDDYDLVLAAAEAGLGIAIARWPLAAAALDSGRLVRLRGPEFAGPKAHHIVTRSGEGRAVIHQLSDALMELVAPEQT